MASEIIEVSYTDVVDHFRQWHKTYATTVLVGVTVAVIISFMVPRYHVSEAQVLAPGNQSAAGAMLSQLGAIAGLAAGAAKQSDEVYVASLTSRQVRNRIIEKHQLQQVYGIDSLEKTREELAARVSVAIDKKTGLIRIEAEDRDPERARNLVFDHIQALEQEVERLAVTEAKARRLFFEREVNKAANALRIAEEALAKSMAERGISTPETLAEVQLRGAGELRAALVQKKAERAALQGFYTRENPEMRRLDAAIQGLQGQIQNLEIGVRQSDLPRESRSLPEYRELKIRNSAFEVLAKQLELARLDEAKEGNPVQIVDEPQVAERATRPRRALIILAGFVLSVGLAFALTLMRGGRQDDSH